LISKDDDLHFNSEINNLYSFKNEVIDRLEYREEQLVVREGSPPEAAVLFLLLINTNQTNAQHYLDNIYLLLEKRSKHLKKNPNDMAFPGGKMDEADENIIQTAYRESQEELGIEPEKLEYLGTMDEFISSSGTIVRTVISWLEIDDHINDFRRQMEKKFSPKTSESERTVVIPLSHFLNPDNYYSVEFFFPSNRHVWIRYFFIDNYFSEEVIWGLTASMIRRFVNILYPNNKLPQELI